MQQSKNVQETNKQNEMERPNLNAPVMNSSSINRARNCPTRDADEKNRLIEFKFDCCFIYELNLSSLLTRGMTTEEEWHV